MTVLLKKAQTEIIIALALILAASVGYTASESSKTQTVVIDSDYNAFSDVAQQIDVMMQRVITNPDEDLGADQRAILYEYTPWAERQEDTQKDLFLAYLEACNQVIIQKSKGMQLDTTEMYSLYGQLVPN